MADDTTHEVRGAARPSTPDANALFAAIRHRRSMGLSRLKPEPVDRRLIERMLEAADWAPSHGDTEPWRFTVFMDEGRERLAELFAEAGGQEGARKRAFAAPVWISIGMDPARREDGSLLMTEDEEIMAVACAVQNLHLTASSLGWRGCGTLRAVPSILPSHVAWGWSRPRACSASLCAAGPRPNG